MEDIIFAGSSARKPVSVAEVELLLDNSDSTLPVDFAEVSIGRRMFRSGESEYLSMAMWFVVWMFLISFTTPAWVQAPIPLFLKAIWILFFSSRPEDRRALIRRSRRHSEAQRTQGKK